ncbi:MAG: hypothetical protein WCP69_04815 [Bacteroidota bacterium]
MPFTENYENPIKENGKIKIEQLKKCKGFENISDEEANKLIDTLYQLSILTYSIYIQKH